MTNKENSPFTPGSPVPVELFVGRTDNINEVRRFIKQTRSGRLEHIFLTFVISLPVRKNLLASTPGTQRKMIKNDHELEATIDRIRYFQQQVEKLRQVEINPQ